MQKPTTDLCELDSVELLFGSSERSRRGAGGHVSEVALEAHILLYRTPPTVTQLYMFVKAHKGEVTLLAADFVLQQLDELLKG